MATKQQEKQPEPEQQDQQERQRILSLIARNVTLGLGQPIDFIRMQVRPLWDDYFRVNVLVGPNVSSVKVAHSYFLHADGAGNILSANPKITKKY